MMLLASETKSIKPTTPQYLPVHVRCTHQSMPLGMTLSTELRVSVPTVGGIKVVFRRECLQNNMPIVMVPNLD